MGAHVSGTTQGTVDGPYPKGHGIYIDKTSTAYREGHDKHKQSEQCIKKDFAFLIPRLLWNTPVHKPRL